MHTGHDKLLSTMIRGIYREIRRAIGRTAPRYERRTKQAGLVVAAHAAALLLAMMAVLAYGRKLRGQFKDLKNHFNIEDRMDVIRACVDDICVVMSDVLSKSDPEYDYLFQIVKKTKPKKGEA